MAPQEAKAPLEVKGQSRAPGADSKKRAAAQTLSGSPTKKPKTADKGNGNGRGKGVGNQSNGNQMRNTRPSNGKSNQSHAGPGSSKAQGSRGTLPDRPHGHQNRKEHPGSSNKPGKPAKDVQTQKSASRQKIHAVRSIPVQKSDNAVKDGELDVQAFLNSRSFEMKALDESMRRSKTSQTRRAFQQVPFTLRRRAAAHNPKRLPKRLQKRAKREMAEDNTPTVNSQTRKPATTRARLRAETARRLQKLAYRKRKQKLLKKSNLDEQAIVTRLARPKIKRNALNRPVAVVKKFKKRQLNKTWLPTHLWHTKRARMTPPLEPLWRFAVPLTRTQKSGMPAHVAQWKEGAVTWDMSYMSTIGLCGTHNSVEHVLRAMGVTTESLWNDKKRGENWRSGVSREQLTLSRKTDGAMRTIGPAIIIWNPETLPSETAESSEDKTPSRRLFIRIHPSIFLETFNELLRLVKGQTPRPYIEDLRFEIGSIDITGPNSTEALACILKSYHSKPESKEAHAVEFESLAAQNELACHVDPRILAFSIMDPRLHSPRRPSVSVAGGRQMELDDQEKDQAEILKPFALFDRNARFRASQLPSQKSISRRKGQSAPGVSLQPTTSDPEIPIMLIADQQQSTSGKWTLMMPWKCVTPVWHALQRCPLTTGGNPMFGGVNEIQQLAFEQGTTWFPGDFPGTDAGMTWELEQRVARKKAWNRMPKGKRVNYETLDLGVGRKGEVGEGWNCDFETLFGLHTPDTETQSEIEQEVSDTEMTDADKDKDAAKTTSNPKKQPASSSQNALSKISHLTKGDFRSYLSPKASPTPPNSIGAVKITFMGRGVPETCARIYRLPSTRPHSTHTEVPATDPPTKSDGKLPADLRDQWLAQMPKKGKPGPAKLRHNSTAHIDVEARTRLLAQELMDPESGHNESINGHPLCPDADDLIGFVTRGGYNLRCGKAQAIGSISAEKAVAEWTGQNVKYGGGVLCIVRNAGENVAWLAKWEPV